MNLLVDQGVFAEDGEVEVATDDEIASLSRSGYRVVAWYTEKVEVGVRTGETREGKYGGDVDVLRYELADRIRFVMKRPAESSMREANKRAEVAEGKVYAAENGKREADAAKAKAEASAAELREQLARATADTATRIRMERDLAMLRDALGSREFSRIVGED